MQYDHEFVKMIRKARNEQSNDELYPLVIAGDKTARDQMTINNSFRVIKKVKEYLKNHDTFKYLWDDLVGAGLEGVARAVDKIARGEVKSYGVTNYIGEEIFGRISERAESEIKEKSSPDLSDNDGAVFPDSYPDEFFEWAEKQCTPEELPIMKLWILGWSGRDIAKKLGLGHTSVNETIQVIFSRLKKRWEGPTKGQTFVPTPVPLPDIALDTPENK